MIGVYDSGFGGLTVLRRLRAALPDRDLHYFGDSGRAPYGGRDVHTILDFAEQAVELLAAQRCRLVVVACNTVSCVALRHLQHRYAGDRLRILGVTIPGAEVAVRSLWTEGGLRPPGPPTYGHVGLVATARTVASRTYETEIHKLAPHVRVTALAAPLLAPIVEEGWEDTDIARLAVDRYLAELGPVDTLLLGCTHYPLLMPLFAARHPRVVDPAPYLADRLVDWLDRHPGFDDGGEGRLVVTCTGDPDRFARFGSRFLGEPLTAVAHVAEIGGRLAARDPREAPVGQVVRG